MTPEENKQLVLDYIDAFINRQDAEAVRNYLAPDFIDHERQANVPPGPETALRARDVLHRAFPDLRVKVEDIIAEDDRVAVRASWAGTHRGTLPNLKIPPTNRSFIYSGMMFFRISDGQIAERWATMDRKGLEQQLTVAA